MTLRILILILISLAAASLIVGDIRYNLWAEAGIAVALGLIWLVAVWREWRRLSGPSFVAWVIVTGLAAWAGVAAGWLLVSLVAALAAWDLSHFSQRLDQVAHVREAAALQTAHLRRMAIVAGLSLAVGLLALTLPLSLSLGWAIGLGLVIVIGLGRVVRRLRRAEDEASQEIAS